MAYAWWQHTDMYLSQIGVRCGEICAHTIESKLRGVIGAAEMGQPEPAHTISAPGIQDCLTSLIIGKVTCGTQDAML